LFSDIRRMPPGQAESLPATTSAAIMAFILQSNGVISGARFLPAVEEALSQLSMPTPGAAPAGAVQRPPVVIAPREGKSRLDSLRPVTAADLAVPPPGDWLQWRRTGDAHGFSPLAQINRNNVAGLQLAWAWSLPQGDNMMTPIVRDGVLFAYSHGDIVEALDAGSGELLWRFERKLDGGVLPNGKKGLAIAGDRLLVPTSDMHVVALNARTGAVLWDHAIDTGGQAEFQIKSAPLVARDKVLIGVNGFTTRGGNFIAAFELATGREAWRFHTVARPGQPGGDSWNGQPVEARTGGSVWVGGSYDSELNLAFFGPAATYNPMAMREPKPGFTNEGLYSNTTLALNPDDGTLVWYYQHFANDQFDHDWAYERQIVELDVSGARRKVVVTGGKQAVFDALDAATGAYLFSVDMGLQNIIAAIDPKTGAKILNPAAILKPGQVVSRSSMTGLCPDLLGARNMMSTSIDARRKLLFAPLTDTCIQPWPKGERWQKTPDSAAAGKYGMLRALDLQSRKVLWTARDKAPPVGGALATAGALIFLGDADRNVRAYDARSGKVLWQARLDNAPVSYPVTYSVDGRQYIAFATNSGFVHVQAMQQAAKARPTPNMGATLWVFALPEKPRSIRR
jgi:alcohol dehydrogenase (cytochrome c)